MSNASNSSEASYPEWVKIGEAAQMLGVSPNSVRKLVREGYLTAYRVKGIAGIQFKKEDVLALIETVRPEELDDND